MIEIENVTFTYDNTDKASLKNINLAIPQGQCILLCGASGCGKTTITRLINGLIPNFFEGKLEGSIKVDDLDVVNAELYETARVVGSVFQNPRSQFFCVDTTSELAFGCENMGLAENEIHKRIDKVKEELHLENLMDRSIFQLSGGEKQKIACGSVACLYPKVIVLDEPTSNLDFQAIKELKEILALWKASGKTIVIAEHRLHWLRGLCDRVVYIDNGEIKKDMPMQEFEKINSKDLKALGLRGLDLDFSLSSEQLTNIYHSSENIDFRDFKFSYDDKLALNIPKLSIPKGSIIAIIGRNGAGKSTFSRCLCGLEKKTKAYIIDNGVIKKRKAMLKSSYMVMQDVNHQLFCETVLEEVQLGMVEENNVKVNQVITDLDLENLTERHPMSLSGGQKQRVAVASSILANKSILLFDEPTSGLDYRHMVKTGQLISELKGEKTVLIVTHDPELIVRCCTHILMLENGELKDFYPMDKEGLDKIKDFFINI